MEGHSGDGLGKLVPVGSCVTGPCGFLRQLCSGGLGASRAAGELHRSLLRSECTPESCTGQTFRSTSLGESHSRQGPRGKQRADEVSTVDSSERPIVRDPREEGQSCMPDQPRPHGGGEQTTRVREESAAHPRRPWGPADPPRESSYTLKHPYSESDTVKGDHFNALAAMNQLPESINRARLARLGEWKRLSTP